MDDIKDFVSKFYGYNYMSPYILAIIIENR